MIKFSIIVPIYNVEKYLDRCLKSILLQCYDNYEVIMICDKSDDGSDDIAKSYAHKHSNFKRIYCENTGLAKAKNIGIKYAKGDYILFLDSDDFFEPNLLKKLSKEIDDNDIVRFQIQEVNNNKTIKYKEKEFKELDGIEAFKKIIHYHFVEPSWAYCYKRDFWNKNKFKFMDNCIAEDFGLTPLIIYKAKSIKSINYIGYNYVIRNDSLMNENKYDLKLKKMYDMLIQTDYLYKMINNKETSFYEFINNSLLTYVTSLKYRDYRKYIKILKNKYNIYKYIPNDSIKRKIKKAIIVFSPYIYKRYIERFL